MTYDEWISKNNIDKNIILNKLKNLTKDEVIEYFNFENMVINEPNYCLLYKTNTKCHNIDKLNCYNCACPHFKYDNTVINGVASICEINSKFASTYNEVSGDNIKIHCDCSNCTIPHNKKHIEKHYD